MKKILCFLLMLAALLCACACEKDNADEAAFAPFSYRGTELLLDAKAEPLIAALGEYVAFGETNSCYGDGKDKVYQYASFKVTTYSQGGVDYLLAVEIFNDSDETATTKEGIGIGAAAADVLATYGEAATQTDSAIIYNSSAVKNAVLFC